jgi:hypothetical protein
MVQDCGGLFSHTSHFAAFLDVSAHNDPLTDCSPVPMIAGDKKEQVRRNLERFPPDFMFKLTEKELNDLRSQIATSSS